jgi:hypothetical protein
VVGAPAGEILLHLLRGGCPGGAVPPLGPGTWEEVEREAVRHGLAPLLYARVRREGGEPAAPAGVLERLRAVYLHSALRAAALRPQLAAMLGALRAEGIDVAVLKGVHLAAEVYGDAALRPMHDVDLLVGVSDLERAGAVLRSLGYTPSHPLPAGGEALRRHQHLPRFGRPGAFPVELHWTPVSPSLSATFPLDDLWETARAVQVAGVEALALSPEHLLHHLCLHLAAHRFRVSLLHVHDVALVARRHPELDWDVLAGIAGRTGSRRLVWVGLSLAERMLPGSVDGARLERFRVDGSEAAVAELVWDLVTGPARDFPWSHATLAGLGGWRAQGRFVWKSLFPPRAQIGAREGLPPGSLRVYWLYVARAADFLRRWGVAALRMGVGGRGARASRERSRGWARVQRWLDTGGDPDGAAVTPAAPPQAR